MVAVDLSKYKHVVNVSELPPGATGYRLIRAAESYEAMAAANVNLKDGADIARRIPEVVGYGNLYEFPPSCNVTDFISPKNQNQVGACGGNATAQAGEGCSWLATDGQVKRYSGWAQYILAQEDDGLRRRGQGFDRSLDVGSTPTGNATAFMNVGLVPEEMCPPEPMTYDRGWEVTDEMRAAAEGNKIKTAVRIRSVEQADKFLKGGLGFLTLACKWMAHFDQPNPEFVLKDFNGPPRQDRHGGGHLTAIMGWYMHPDYGLCFVLVNSWSKKWMDEGAVLVTAQWLFQALRDDFTIVTGFSDLLLDDSEKIFVPRAPKITGGNIFGKR